MENKSSSSGAPGAWLNRVHRRVAMHAANKIALALMAMINVIQCAPVDLWQQVMNGQDESTDAHPFPDFQFTSIPSEMAWNHHQLHNMPSEPPTVNSVHNDDGPIAKRLKLDDGALINPIDDSFGLGVTLNDFPRDSRFHQAIFPSSHVDDTAHMYDYTGNYAPDSRPQIDYDAPSADFALHSNKATDGIDVTDPYWRDFVDSIPFAPPDHFDFKAAETNGDSSTNDEVLPDAINTLNTYVPDAIDINLPHNDGFGVTAERVHDPAEPQAQSPLGKNGKLTIPSTYV
jgi:hypothetical protein